MAIHLHGLVDKHGGYMGIRCAIVIQKHLFATSRKYCKIYFWHPNMPTDLVPYWDFNAPEIPNEPRDVSAAAVIASGLYELANTVKTKKNTCR